MARFKIGMVKQDMFNRLVAIPLLLLATCSYPAPASSDQPRLTATQFALLDRLTWGANASDAAVLVRQGSARWLDEQLHPPATDAIPAEVAAQIAALPLGKDMTTTVIRLEAISERAIRAPLLSDRQRYSDDYLRELQLIGNATADRAVLRALYNPAQLKEQLSWFWFNHFNVLIWAAPTHAMIADYEDRAIRPHVLGKFRDLLEATVRHPAMLRYLGNNANTATTGNENYARELLELHTMGVGSGYTQQDVQALARILTGVGYTTVADPPKLGSGGIRDGLFEFDPAKHDFGNKLLLGHKIKGSGYGEVTAALDLLAAQPATAQHVSERLAQFFIGDHPSRAVVDAMAARFVASGGDIAAVLATLFTASEFTVGGTAFKDPMHYTLAAVRLVHDGRRIAYPHTLVTWIGLQGEGPYVRQTPDGYPLTGDEWAGPGQMAGRFDMSRTFVNPRSELFVGGKEDAAPVKLLPLKQRIADAGLFPKLASKTREALLETTSEADWAALLLSSPDFMRR